MDRASNSGGAPGSERRLKAAAERLARAGEIIVVAAGGVLIMIAVLLAAATLFVLFFQRLGTHWDTIESIEGLQTAVEKVFAGVLLLMLGLELLETLKSYFVESQIRIEVILVVAMIAVTRHIMLLDIEHVGGPVLLGSAALTLALALSYALIRATRTRSRTTP
jgi:uncharacterized membrane protein (DUF373 family)